MKPIRILFLCIFLASGSLYAQKLVEKVDAKSGSIVIPYTKYVLPNGLTVILHEDHSDPLVHVDVTYHVGSGREEIGKSGFAHFFEHMMFQGSRHVADDEHFKIITEAGGELNGTTNRDRTNYFETAPANYLELLLWLEADRMGFLLDSVTQRKFEIQRETVKNERGQNVDNVPYGRGDEAIYQHLYPYGHPYSWETIGFIEDLNRVDVNDLRKFFLRWYGPNNAVLTVGGDFDSKKALEYIMKYFAPIPKGPEVKNMAPMPANLTADRYTTLEDKVRLPDITMVFPTVPNFHPDAEPLSALARILGGGKTSYFYQAFVKSEKAKSAYAFSGMSELSGELELSVRGFPDQKLGELESMIREQLAKFETTGVTDDDLARYKGDAETRFVEALANVSFKCSRLAYYQTFISNPNFAEEALRRINAVTKEDIMRVYNTYVKGKACVILSIVPEGRADLAASQNLHQIDKTGWTAPPDQYSALKERPVKDKFDRSKRPVPGTLRDITLPEHWVETLSNGAEIVGCPINEVPMVNIELDFRGYYDYLGKNMDKAGVSTLTLNLLNEGNAKYTAEQFSLELEKLGASVQFFTGSRTMTCWVRCHRKYLTDVVQLLKARLLEPSFTEEDFQRLLKQQKENVKESETRPASIAALVFNRLIFGETMPDGLPVQGTLASLEKMTLQDCKNFYNEVIKPKNLWITVTGDISKEETMEALSFISDWKTRLGGASAGDVVVLPTIDKTRLYLVDKPGAPQSQIYVGAPSEQYNPIGGYYYLSLMNYPLGGMFSSRLNMLLREKRGFTYGIRSRLEGDDRPGPWAISTGVRTNATDSAITDIVNTVRDYRDKGITPEELAFTKSSLSQKNALSFESYTRVGGFMKNIIRYDVPSTYITTQQEILRNITQAEINAMASKYLPVEKMHILVVGDKSVILPGLKKLGYEIIELDKAGNKIGNIPLE